MDVQNVKTRAIWKAEDMKNTLRVISRDEVSIFMPKNIKYTHDYFLPMEFNYFGIKFIKWNL